MMNYECHLDKSKKAKVQGLNLEEHQFLCHLINNTKGRFVFPLFLKLMLLGDEFISD